MSNTLNITEYNLLDYSLKLQEAVEKGYRVSDGVEGSPMMVGFVYTTTLLKRENEYLPKEYKEALENEQAKIDADMLENNPEEMSEDQVNNLAEKQVKFVEPVVEETGGKAPSKRGRK